MLAAAFPELKEWRLADMLLGLCLRAWKHRKAGHSYLDMVEFFAGSGNRTKEFMRRKKLWTSCMVNIMMFSTRKEFACGWMR